MRLESDKAAIVKSARN
jgi:hypothetical protein